ncbi:hypothetical protein M7775_18140 [Sporomusa sphaeroides DSM 2875]|uniref:hypothetical protein n=1 Tax=Sporomusa sphaeroides TaxID=47679 RepID=UPI002030A10B|nr:hypothetical protein [Sporomusa sphaeroides]MCM0760477.1 hypothetical protein [Sporomusa sphaeroides DSM 2875]
MHELSAHIYQGCNFKIIKGAGQEITQKTEEEYHHFTSTGSFGIAICDKQGKIIALFHSEWHRT